MNIGAQVADMGIVVNRRPAAVKADFPLLKGLERLTASAKCIVKGKRHRYRIPEKLEIGN